ncbi:MAG: sigma-54 dependent transcriptional regulator, partial [Thermoguttaceae bacterium]|nr:sigma-54 dependent transcriptional regulator [Thermoguttaceae bacterium]
TGRTTPKIIKNDIENGMFNDPFDIVLLDDKWGTDEMGGQDILLEPVYRHIHGPENELPLIVLYTRHWDIDRLSRFFDHVREQHLDPNRLVPCKKQDSGQFQQVLFRVLATKQLEAEKRFAEKRAVKAEKLTKETQAALDVCGYSLETLPISYPEIIGHSIPMRIVFAKIFEAANDESPVLIMGETGTGKELIAQAIHRESPRNEKECCALNCAAISASLAESELFGHEKGTFTGATEKKIGKFEVADGGTLFLDEIGDLSQDIQAMLLRVLQEKTFQRVGGNQDIKSDFRLIAATKHNLRELVENGTFREDLLYRLDVFQIQLPPLRERGDDFQDLLEYFINKYSKEPDPAQRGFEPKVLDDMMDRQWNGNVRELENCIKKLLVRTKGKKIRAVHIGDIETLGVRPNPRRGRDRAGEVQSIESCPTAEPVKRFDLFIQNKIVRNQTELAWQLLEILDRLPEGQAITDEELAQKLNREGTAQSAFKKKVTQACSRLRKTMGAVQVGWTIQKGTARRLVRN